MNNDLLNQWKGKLIVSCQALEEEPLHSPFIMGKMALAAAEGGAAGIRANGVHDIAAIKNEVTLPVISLKKSKYEDSEVFITPTLKEVKELLTVKPDMIAIDATNRKRPNDETLSDILKYIRQQSHHCLLMADVSTFSEAQAAERLGFDCVSTTLVGYTEETQGLSIADNHFSLLKQMVGGLTIPIVAEGKISTPHLAKEALQQGAHCVVVGGAITRPQQITNTFIQEIDHIFL